MSMITNRNRVLTLSAAMLVALLVSTPVFGNEKKVPTTTVTVGEMCSGCVKRITARFDKEKDISRVSCDIKQRSVTLFPAKDVRLSPKKLWEIFESIGKKPQKLVGPDGTYTSKPKKS
ncbi:MAG: cation transporter [Planctomycetota bacterium]